MADVSDKLNELERELNNYKSRQEEYVKKLKNTILQQQESIKEYVAKREKELNSYYTSKYSQLSKQYEQKYQNTVNMLSYESQKKFIEYEDKCQELKNQLIENEREIKRTHEELEDFENKHKEHEEELGEEAERLKCEFEEIENNEEKHLPCNKYFRITSQEIDVSKTILNAHLKKGWFSSACAIAIGLKSRLQSLRFDTKKEIEKWQLLFDELKIYVDSANRLLKFEENIVPRTWEAFDLNIDFNIDQIRFWSNGEICTLEKIIKADIDFIERVEKESINVYLRSDEALSVEELAKKVEEAEKTFEKIPWLRDLSINSANAGLERYLLSCFIREYAIDSLNMEEVNAYDPVLDNTDVDDKSVFNIFFIDGDWRKELTMEYKTSIVNSKFIDNFKVVIVPVRKGNITSNEIIFFYESQHGGNIDTTEERNNKISDFIKKDIAKKIEEYQKKHTNDVGHFDFPDYSVKAVNGSNKYNSRIVTILENNKSQKCPEPKIHYKMFSNY